MIVADTMNPPMASREALSAQPPAAPDSQTPNTLDEVMDDPVAEALAFATRITARVRKPGDLTPLGVPRVA